MNESSASLNRIRSNLKLRVACAIPLFCAVLFAFGSSPTKVVASPGSALDQYVEEVPNAGGSEPTSELTPGDPATSLGKETLQQFQKFGKDGYDAALTASAGKTPSQIVGKNTVDFDGSGSPPRARGIASTDSGIGEVLGTATGVSGSGSGLLLLLVSIGVILTMATVAVRRNRSA